eukprot:91966-Pyramimonas_sp.AAC.3
MVICQRDSPERFEGRGVGPCRCNRRRLCGGGGRGRFVSVAAARLYFFLCGNVFVYLGLTLLGMMTILEHAP